MQNENKSSAFTEDISQTNTNVSTRNNVVKNEETSVCSQLLLPQSHYQNDVEVQGSGKLQESFTISSTFSEVRQRFSGWKAGLTLGISADIFVLTTVLSLTLAAAFGSRRDGDNAILVDQDCEASKRTSIWLHLLINIFSTILLSTSSYAMQCLGSPTRDEVSKAHAKGKYLNIGVPSLSNLWRVRRSRMALYVALILTSVPLHLLANSIVYETVGANSYVLAVVDQPFISRPLSELYQLYEVSITGFHSIQTVIGGKAGNGTQGNKDNYFHLGNNFTATLKNLVPEMERLDNQQCIEAYSDPFSSTRSNIIAVAARPILNVNNTNFVLSMYYQSVDFCPTCQTYENWTNPALWTCAFTTDDSFPVSCDPNKAVANAGSFSIDDIPIDYCLSQKAAEKCQLQANIPLMVVVIVCAFAKTAILFVVRKTLPSEIFATIGDAIASFLQNPDPNTVDACLLDRFDVQTKKWKPGQYFPKHWTSTSRTASLAQGPRASAWARLWILMLSVVVIAIALLGLGITKLRSSKTGVNDYDNSGSPPIDGGSLWRMGFGTVNVNTILQLPNMSSPNSVIAHVLLVNTPQVVLSIVYFAYNTCWTHMLIAREWAQFGRGPRPLRTSSPVGEQRMQYFLTIPWKIGLPLQVASALLHWLLSQSFFLARVNAYSAEPFVDIPPAIINTVGYSIISIMFFIILWALLFIAITGFGFGMRLKSPIPIVAGCSLAISAACHAPKTDVHCALKPLTWGIVDSMEKPDGVKHCCFSTSAYSPETLVKTEKSKYGTKYEETTALFA